MKSKYKIMLSTILVLLTFLIYICFDYSHYLKNNVDGIDENAIVFSMGEISVNFLLGDEIEFETGEYVKEFSVTNVSNRETYYNINLIDVINEFESDVNLRIESSDDGGSLNNFYPKDDVELFNKVKIGPSVTQRYKVILSSESKGIINGKIVVRTEDNSLTINNPLAEVILKDNKVKTSNVEDGLIKGLDSDGATYYFKGNVDNNYVNFANYKWRIVRITGRGLVKLILDEDVSGVIGVFNDKDNGKNVVNLSTSSGMTILNDWYNETLLKYDEQIGKMKYAINLDYNLTKGTINYFGGYNRLFNGNNPTYQVAGQVEYTKIGLLSADEAVMAGASSENENKEYYLYNEMIINDTYTFTPYSYNDINGNANVIGIDSVTGKIKPVTVDSEMSLRPVIVLNENIKVSGSGLEDDPYVIS